MDFAGLKLVQATYEYESGEFVYRITIDASHVYVKRTASDRPMWTHGVLTQAYDRSTKTFGPQCMAQNVAMSHDEADELFKTL